MIFASQLVNLACLIGGKRFSHQVLLRRLKKWRSFEPEYYLLDHLVDPTSLAVDVGANVGIYSGRLAQICPRVHSFEPIPHLANALREKLPTSVTVHQSALSNSTGTVELRIPYRGDVELHGASTLEPGNPLPGSTQIQTIPCTVERLDDVLRERVGFIKIDVEGHELAVLEGARRILGECKPVLLIESEKRHNSNAPENVFSYLAKLGYGGFFLKAGRPTMLSAFQASLHQNLEEHGQLYVYNFIFLPDS